MRIRFIVFLLILTCQTILSQEKAFEAFLSDSSMKHAAVSFYLADTDNGIAISEYCSDRSLMPASVMKLVTTSAAIELLGPDFTFNTELGYTGELNKKTGILKGDIVIKGGGDPALGSGEFGEHYTGFEQKWIDNIRENGIRKVKGKIITDDSYYDYQPVPGKWLWEDAGNYYGAGAYGLSVYDNTCEIHFNTSSANSDHVITTIVPEECTNELTDYLSVSGTEDKGYIYAAPYSSSGWMAGTIPANRDDFVLKASITDPPLLLAEIIDKKSRESGIIISGKPTTVRAESVAGEGFVTISKITSPPLKEIINVLNHESVNLYAEHLIKELGKKFRNDGSTISGTEAVKEFLTVTGISTDGIFMEDGSGLSPLNSVSARAITDLLLYMKNKSKYPAEFINSLPEAGKEGTLKSYFNDPVFESRLSAKSGSMTRVRSYAGYVRTISNKELAFCIIVNNFTGPSGNIVAHIEEILKEIIITN
jgi:D-alanyl-D-alanine carboxypeptidase/D-alanyl-D-alanine-endopeptidase (penicillin-binding protein 4)